MKINFGSVNKKESFPIKVPVDKFNKLTKDPVIKKFKSIEGRITLFKVDSILTIDFDIDANITFLSTYSFKPFDKVLEVHDTLYYTDKPELEDDDIFLVGEGGSIDLDEDIYSLILSFIPIDIHIENEEMPSGDGYRVIREEDLGKSEESSPFDCLKDIDVEDKK